MATHDDIRYLLRRVSELEERVKTLEAEGGEFGGGFSDTTDPLAPSAYVLELIAADHNAEATEVYRKENGIGRRDAIVAIRAIRKAREQSR